MEVNYSISINFNQKPGSIIRVAVIFERRGHTIGSLQINPGIDNDFSEMMISAKGPADKKDQIIKQLARLIDVIEVTELVKEEILVEVI